MLFGGKILTIKQYLVFLTLRAKSLADVGVD